MKISIERATLLKAVGQAQSVVERRNTIPILANVLIEAEGDTVSFRATDLDIEVVDKVSAEVERAGATTVSAVMLHEIVRKLPEGALVQISEDAAAGRLTVQAGRSMFSLATLPREDFPIMASSEYSANFSAPAPLLRRLFDKSKFAISTEETRYYLNGVYMHVAQGESGKVLRCVATDGHRLARIDAPLPDSADDMPGVIVPRKTVNELHRLIADGDSVVRIGLSENKIRFAFGNIVLTSKLIDGTFPDYERVIPTGNDKVMTVATQLFREAVDRVSTISTEKSRAVKLILGDSNLTLQATSPDAGSATEEVEVAYSEDGMEIGFNSRYLLDIANQIEGEEMKFELADSGSPTIIRNTVDDTSLYVLMPMRV